MKNTIVISLLCSLVASNSVYGCWHMWSEQFEAPYINHRTYSYEERIKMDEEDRERQLRWYKERRLEKMQQFRLGMHDDNSLVSMVPQEVVDLIHQKYKDIDQNELL